MAAKVAGYRAEGYRKFQLKVGGDPDDDIARIQAVPRMLAAGRPPRRRRQHRLDSCTTPPRVVRRGARRRRLHRAALPAPTRNACPSAAAPITRSCSTRSIDGARTMLLRGHADGAMDVVNLKISKLGGLTKTRQVRDLCVSLGIAMTLEDSWGGDIVTAAIAHLAHSTPPEFLFTATDFNSYVTLQHRPRRTTPRSRAACCRHSAGAGCHAERLAPRQPQHRRLGPRHQAPADDRAADKSLGDRHAQPVEDDRREIDGLDLAAGMCLSRSPALRQPATPTADGCPSGPSRSGHRAPSAARHTVPSALQCGVARRERQRRVSKLRVNVASSSRSGSDVTSICRALGQDRRKRRLKPTATHRSARSASARIAVASVRDMAMGFSISTCQPPARHRRARLAWVAGGVAMSAASAALAANALFRFWHAGVPADGHKRRPPLRLVRRCS